MKNWVVRLCRDTTESVDVEVEAETADEANDKALAKAGKYGNNVRGWEGDDCVNGPPYIPDQSLTEEIE